MKLQIECKITLELEVPDDWTSEYARFYIEDNSCPGTGMVGAELERIYHEHEEAGTCWACFLRGENKIVGGLPS